MQPMMIRRIPAAEAARRECAMKSAIRTTCIFSSAGKSRRTAVSVRPPVTTAAVSNPLFAIVRICRAMVAAYAAFE